MSGERGYARLRRRDVLAAIAGVTTWPRRSYGEQRDTATIGFLYFGSLRRLRGLGGAFRKGLADTGYVEGRNVVIAYREANYDLARLPELARDLLSRRVDLIWTPGSLAAALAVKAATTTTPILFTTGTDPVEAGLVASLSHPGGNVTGIADFGIAATAKRMELIRLLVPSAAKIALLVTPEKIKATSELADARELARSLGFEIALLQVGTTQEIETTFATLAREGVDAVSIAPSALFLDSRERLVALASQHRLPTIHPAIQCTQIGGLASYGVNLLERSYLAGVYMGLILNGQKPGDLPVRRITNFQLAINMTTAKTLGLTVPASFLALADKVIE